MNKDKHGAYAPHISDPDDPADIPTLTPAESKLAAERIAEMMKHRGHRQDDEEDERRD